MRQGQRHSEVKEVELGAAYFSKESLFGGESKWR